MSLVIIAVDRVVCFLRRRVVVWILVIYVYFINICAKIVLLDVMNNNYVLSGILGNVDKKEKYSLKKDQMSESTKCYGLVATANC